MDGRNSRVASHGSHVKFVNKLRNQLEQERNKNQELSKRIRNLAAKNNEHSKQGKNSARYHELNAELKDDLQRLRWDLKDIFERLDGLKEEKMQQKGFFNPYARSSAMG